MTAEEYQSREAELFEEFKIPEEFRGGTFSFSI